ncbi:MAG TPA: hypothetical protein ENJ87_01980 [Gammaproteobacteria bacterium]|nr:hypothetical protein [Gammaproteobacteria bacterium]
MVSRLLKVPDMISRRHLLLSMASVLLLPEVAVASRYTGEKLDWIAFQIKMAALADAESRGSIDQQVVADRGLQLLRQLDIYSSSFKKAVEASYESGNRFWLWQRLLKGRNINGGILNIDDQQIVQLHDHPGATGMVRIISGEVEAWQFDEAGKSADIGQGMVELSRVSRHILRAGDTALLTPDKGNIHALRSISRECRMLDFFIPPYQRSERHWFEPITDDWFDRKTIACRKISQQVFVDT